LILLNSQPLISPADVSWALHRSPESGTLAAVVKRGSAPMTVAITLPAGWRAKSDISKRVGTWPMRAMALGGMILEDLPDEDRAKLGIAKDRMALRAKGVGAYGKHAAAKNAGFVKEDVITELDGSSARITESGLIGKLLKDHKDGDRVKATVLRGDKRVELMLPIQ
jgi:S1-C subfamily serine protease